MNAVCSDWTIGRTEGTFTHPTAAFSGRVLLPLFLALVSSSSGVVLAVNVRRCVQISGPQSPALFLTAFVFAVGVACGIMVVKCLDCGSRSKVRSMPPDLIGPVLVGSAALTAAGQAVCPLLNDISAFLSGPQSPWRVPGTFGLLVAACLNVLPGCAFGILCTLFLARRHGKTSSEFLRACSRLIVLACGMIGGFLVTARCIIPVLGTLPSIAFALVLLVASVPVAGNLLRWTANRTVVATAVAGLALTCLRAGLGPWYCYGKSQLPPGTTSEFFRTGQSYDVRVIRHDGELQLELDGTCIGGTGLDRSGEIALACLPRLLRPEARRLLIIGLGTGAVLQGSLLFPDTEVVCAEPEPALIEASKLFQDASAPPASAKAVTMMQLSGDAGLRARGLGVDLVLVNYGSADLPATWRCLSFPFLKRTRTALTEGGLLAERLDLESFSAGRIAEVARTALKAFEYCTLVPISDAQYLLLCSGQPVVPPTNMLVEAQSLVARRQSIAEAILPILGSGDTERIVAQRPWLFSRGMKHLAERDFESATIGRTAAFRVESSSENSLPPVAKPDIVSELVCSCFDPSEYFAVDAIKHCVAHDPTVCHEVATILASHREMRKALAVANWGLGFDLRDPDLLMDRMIWTRERDPQAIREMVSAAGERSATAVDRCGRELLAAGNPEAASIVYETLAVMLPRSATVWTRLSECYAQSRQHPEALRAAEKAANLDPLIVGQSKNKPAQANHLSLTPK